jgi:hypothetical protein
MISMSRELVEYEVSYSFPLLSLVVATFSRVDPVALLRRHLSKRKSVGR